MLVRILHIAEGLAKKEKFGRQKVENRGWKRIRGHFND